MNPSMPNSKKRCWTLRLKDIKKTNAKESEVLSSFRKRYTSARRLAFRSPTAYELNQTAGRSAGEGGILCIDIQFTGPQPIEGPASLLCNLLQASFVAAQPIQLGRGRKRKSRAGVSAPQAPLFASSANGGSRTAGSTSASATSTFFSSFANIHSSVRSGAGSSSGENVGSISTDASSTSRSGAPGNASTSSRSLDGPANACSTAFTNTAKNLSHRLPTSWEDRSPAAAVTPSPPSALPSVAAVESSGGPLAVRAAVTAPTSCTPNRRRYAWVAPAVAGSSPGTSCPRGTTCSAPSTPRRFPPAPPARTNVILRRLLQGSSSGGQLRHSLHYRCRWLHEPPPSNPGLGSAGSYYKFPTSADTTGGAEDDDVWGLIPDEADAPTLGRHSSSCWALHPVHAGITVVSNYGDKADDSGAGAQPDHSCISAAPVVEVDNPRAEEHDLAFGWREEECDFDGRPIKASGFSDKSDSLGGKYPFSFHGLETAGRGYELRDFSVRAQFFTDARGSNVAERVSSLCRVDASGVVHATVAYPSIQEIWPAVYSMSSIKAIEVNMIVEIRSRDGRFVRTGPTLKVMYRCQVPATTTSTAMSED